MFQQDDRAAPLAVCRTTDLAEPGAYWTADVAGTPVLVVRDSHGTVRAFENLCRHRGVRLVYGKRGVTRSFTCVLHGWVYDHEGQMGGAVVARLASANPMLRALRDNNALTPLPYALRHGFVWVVPDPRGVVDVASSLGPVDLALAAREVEDHVVRGRSSVDTDGDLSAAVRARAAATDIVHSCSPDLAIVLHASTISVFTMLRRRTETDFGELTTTVTGATTLEHVLLAPALARE